MLYMHSIDSIQCTVATLAVMSYPTSVVERLNCETFIRDRVRNGQSHHLISLELQQMYPGLPGLSTRSVRRYCSSQNIHYSSRLNEQALLNLVEESVFRVRKLWL